MFRPCAEGDGTSVMSISQPNPCQTRTTCPYCGVGCGILVTREHDRKWIVEGDPNHPANFGRLCSKGSALDRSLGLEGRLLYPEIKGERVPWETALDEVATGLQKIIENHGPDSVAFYLSGQLLTEDYYVANKLMKGFIGSPHVDTNSRLCMASSVAAHRRAFGSDTVPGCYKDLDEADLVILVGSNTAWCHPVLFQRIKENKLKRGARIVNIDTRWTATSEDADLQLTLKPGADAVLFNGLLTYLVDKGALDGNFIDRHCEGFEGAVACARAAAGSIEKVASETGLSRDSVLRFFEWFSQTEKTVSCYSQGVNQSTSGTDKVNAIINCHLATGRIGRAGMGPFSLTGQPNAMGGREVGALANQLAAHMGFENPAEVERVGRFWGAPNLAKTEGLKAVQLFEAVRSGRIKAIWIMATNPAVSLPNTESVKAALRTCELVVVSDCYRDTDTLTYAHIKLPAAAWGEKDGTVTNSERCISRQRSFLPLPGEAKPDWWIICEVARRMGFGETFGYSSPNEIFREHATLSGFENNGHRDFDIKGLSELDAEGYNRLDPVQWPFPVGAKSGADRLFANGGFFTPDRRAKFIPVVPSAPLTPVNDEFPLVLNTGRLRDQWHTMTRTGKIPSLSQHQKQPSVTVHPQDAVRFNIRDGDLARLATRWGTGTFRVEVSENQQPGSIFAPIHWSGQNSSAGGVGPLVNPWTDPISGQPESKHTPVAIRPAAFGYRGFCLTQNPLTFPRNGYWAMTREDHCLAYLFSLDPPTHGSWTDWASSLTRHRWEDLTEFMDDGVGIYRVSVIQKDRLETCIYLSPNESGKASPWLKRLFAENELDRSSRQALLSGGPKNNLSDPGPIVCTCFAVGKNLITEAISATSMETVEEIGRLLRAGTNCGSCIPELKALLRDAGNGIRKANRESIFGENIPAIHDPILQ